MMTFDEKAYRKVYQKEYYLKNKDKIDKKNKEYKISHEEKYRETNKAHYKNNREKYLKLHKEYNLKNKAKSKEYRLKNKKSIQNNFLKLRYGITLEEKERIMKEQNFVCPICLQPLQENEKKGLRIVIDHCHKTKKIRGVVHLRCNSALGFLNDNPDICINAANYLKRNK